MKTQNKNKGYEEEKITSHEDRQGKENKDEDVKPYEEENNPDDDLLEVVIEEEKDEQDEIDTNDDLFDDDELDLDPSLDRGEW